MAKEYKIEIKHPRFNDEFFGFKEIEQYFLDILKKKKISNAYIFNGIKGIGKATFAYRLARCILNKDNNLESIDSLYISKENNIFKNIMNLSHPDISIIEPDDENKKMKTPADALNELQEIAGFEVPKEYKERHYTRFKGKPNR